MLRKINLICVGGLKKDYLKKLERFNLGNINLVIVEDSTSEVESKNILRILNKYKDKFCVLFDLKGKSDKSTFNEILTKFNSTTNIFFIIGGSYGVGDELVRACDLLLKISDFTYSHQIFRITAILIIREIFSKNL